jgi:hypothetical protein
MTLLPLSGRVRFFQDMRIPVIPEPGPPFLAVAALAVIRSLAVALVAEGVAVFIFGLRLTDRFFSQAVHPCAVGFAMGLGFINFCDMHALLPAAFHHPLQVSFKPTVEFAVLPDVPPPFPGGFYLVGSKTVSSFVACHLTSLYFRIRYRHGP